MSPRKKRTVKTPKEFLSPEHLERLLRYDAELKNAHLTLRVTELEWEVKKKQQAELMARVKNDLTTATRQWMEVAKVIEEEYGISLKEHAYDPETGRLTKLPE